MELIKAICRYFLPLYYVFRQKVLALIFQFNTLYQQHVLIKQASSPIKNDLHMHLSILLELSQEPKETQVSFVMNFSVIQNVLCSLETINF